MLPSPIISVLELTTQIFADGLAFSDPFYQ